VATHPRARTQYTCTAACGACGRRRREAAESTHLGRTFLPSGPSFVELWAPAGTVRTPLAHASGCLQSPLECTPIASSVSHLWCMSHCRVRVCGCVRHPDVQLRAAAGVIATQHQRAPRLSWTRTRWWGWQPGSLLARVWVCALHDGLSTLATRSAEHPPSSRRALCVDTRGRGATHRARSRTGGHGSARRTPSRRRWCGSAGTPTTALCAWSCTGPSRRSQHTHPHQPRVERSPAVGLGSAVNGT
jgi:hypothetical protein